MNAKHWMGDDEREFSPRPITDRPRCMDCSATQTERWFHFPAGVWCESCFCVRESRGELSDARTRAQIHAAAQRQRGAA